MSTSYKEIGTQYFLKGMYAASDVFYVQHERPVLLCSQALFTEDSMIRLADLAAAGARIYVSEEEYVKLMEQYHYFSRVNDSTQKNYEAFKGEFSSFLTDTKLTGTIDVDESVRLSHTLESLFGQVDISFVLQWSSYMRSIDEYLNTHSINVSILNGLMANWLGMDVQEKEKLIQVGLLHDIGKTMIPEHILNKPGRLTAEEFNVIKTHPVYSYEIMKRSGITDETILSGIRGHHEKMNGSGYPDGLSFNNIPVYAKITAVSDIYDAMVARRSYKNAKSPFEVLDRFYKNKFSDLDLHLVDVFLDRLANEMIGKEVLLSDGTIAKIVYIEKANYAFPLIERGQGNVVQTTEKLKCISLCSELGTV